MKITVYIADEPQVGESPDVCRNAAAEVLAAAFKATGLRELDTNEGGYSVSTDGVDASIVDVALDAVGEDEGHTE